MSHSSATPALLQVLGSPELRQAVASKLLGGGGRQSVRFNGVEISNPAYFQMISRLCLDAAEVYYLCRRIVERGKTLIGFDLVEVGVGITEWDAVVGARVLFKLSNLLIRSSK